MLPDCPDHAAAARRVSELQARFPLPEGCSWADVLLERTRVGELDLGMVGLVANLPGEQSATGAAASSGGGLPVDRAFFELLERIAILLTPVRAGALALRDRAGRTLGSRAAASVFSLDDPVGQRSSRSNGVALHSGWSAACAAAQHELIERDHVLRSFQGEFAPRRCAGATVAITHALRDHYTLEAYAFDPSPQPTAAVRGVFLLPRSAEAPLVYGFAAADSGEAALAGAEREALQRLAFLWGEGLPDCAPEPSATPDYHQDYYLYPPHHARLRDWLSGEADRSPLTATGYSGEETSFLDLTPERWSDQVAVARATSSRAQPLRFGPPADCEIRDPHPIV